MTSRVYLSFGRHGRYGTDTAIDRVAMLESYIIGCRLREELPPCDAVYHSPIARAVLTAQFRTLGLDCSTLREIYQLSDETPTFEIRKFINNLLLKTDEPTRHYHLITHLPVIEKLGLPELGCGEVCVCAANSWDDMLAENYSRRVINTATLAETTDLLAQLRISETEFATLTAEQIRTLIKNS